MKTPLLLTTLAGAALLAQAVPAEGQEVPPSTAVYTETGGPPTPPPTSALQAPTAFDKLVGPIALYPDPLVSVLLPAATHPDQLEAANTYLTQYADASQIDNQPWDPSVKALAHYPTVVSWMAENMSWTQALGAAFASSPGDVMDSVQKLRAIAEANGTLQATPQQSVMADGDDIDILPAQADEMYVPTYDPNVVFADYSYGDYEGPFINYGDPWPVGGWLTFGFDWRNHRVWTGDYGIWHGRDGWRQPHFPDHGVPPGVQPWHSPGASAVIRNSPGPRVTGSPEPRLMQGVPNPPPGHYQGEVRTNENSYVVNPGRTGVSPQPRPRLNPTEHSPVPGVDYTPPSRAPEMRNNRADNGATRGQTVAPREGEPTERAAPREEQRAAPVQHAESHESAPHSSGGGERERH